MASTIQPKPQTYSGQGYTEQQLKELYGTNPSLVTTNAGKAASPAANTLTAAYENLPFRQPDYDSGQAYDYQGNAIKNPVYANPYDTQGGYGVPGAMNETEMANAEELYREQMGKLSPALTGGYNPGNAEESPYYQLGDGSKVYGGRDNLAAYFYADEPQPMTREEAQSIAGNTLNPTYDSLRSRAETEMSDAKELIPQMMAARYGMGGMRGGRLASSYVDQSQREAATMSDIEGKRQQAINEYAEALRTNNYQMAMQAWQASQGFAIQQQQLALQVKSQETENWYKKAMYLLQIQGFTADEAQRQLENNPLWWKNQMEQERNSTDLAGKRASTQALLNEQDPEYWKNQAWLKSNDLDDLYKQTQINKMQSTGGTGGRGSSGSADGGLNYNTALIRATDLAKADPRLADGLTTIADGVNYFSLPQLVDAYMTQLAYATY